MRGGQVMLRLLLCAAALFLGFPARAASSQVIDFESPADERPGYACVLHVGRDGSRPAGSLLKDGAPAPSVPADNAKRKSPDVMTEAWTALLTPTAPNACTPNSDCAANFELPGNELKTQASCARLSGGDKRRVVVIDFRLDALVNLKEVVGGTQSVTVDIDGELGAGGIGFPSTRVLGGSYQAGNPIRGDATNPIRLVLTPRCPRYSLHIPPMEGRKDGACVQAEISKPDGGTLACNTTLTNELAPLGLPRTAIGGKVTAKVFKEASCAGTPVATLTGVVRSSDPATPIDGLVTNFGFEWVPPCNGNARAASDAERPARPDESDAEKSARATLTSLPKQDDDCPEVSLPGALATRCDRSAANDHCVYTCTAAEGVRLPTRAVFTLPVRPEGARATLWSGRWEDSVERAGQSLHGFVPASERSVVVDFSDWGATNADVYAVSKGLGNRVNWVAFTRPDGSTVPVYPTKRFVRLAVPGLECGDNLTYRSIGERDHVQRSVEVRGGRVVVERSSKTGEVVSLYLHVGGGLEMAVEHGGADPNGRYDTGSHRAFGHARLSGEFFEGPARMIVLLSLRVAARSYFPVSSADSQTGTMLTYEHLLFGAGPIWALGHVEPFASTWFGFAPVVGFGFASFGKDTDKLGTARLSVGLQGMLRYPLSRRVLTEFGLHVYPFQRYYAYATDYLGAPSRISLDTTLVGIEAGMTFGM
ncbi:MAG: hypothetical protein ACOY0T_06860 [Myxococcota bacterium]